MVKKFKLSHLSNSTVLLVLCHFNVSYATDISSDLNYSLYASKQTATDNSKVTHLWSKQMKGAISDLSISQDGKAILVATSPDSDIEGSSNQYLLSKYGSKGKVIWQLKQHSPIKEVAVSQDAALVVVANYENQLFALNSAGKLLWTNEGMCKPIILNMSKKVLCYHDDDNEPKTGFDLYNWKGLKLLSYSITRDVLALKVSADEKNLVLGFTGGGVELLSPEFVPLWHESVPGEIIDISVSSGALPVVAVLYREKMNPKVEKIAVFNSVMGSQGSAPGNLPGNSQDNSEIKILSPSAGATQIELSTEGTGVFYYGNNSSGQHLGSLSLLSLKELWKRGGTTPAEFSSTLSVIQSEVFASFQENAQGERRIHIVSFDHRGELRKDLGLTLEQSAYLYAYKLAPAVSLLVVGTDDGKVSVYHY